MEYTKTPAGIMIPKSNEFDLMQTLDCGQSFRWEPCNEKSNRIGGIAFGRYLELEESDKHILFCDTEEDDFLHIWVPYFDLELDYKSIKDDLSELDPILYKAAQYAPGIRILQQDPWEALCCFIISQNNNIPRIKGIVSRLCEHFGEKIPGGFAFPAPEVLANCTVEDLAPLRSGVFPAGAGVIPFMKIFLIGSRSFPRRCGGDPQSKNKIERLVKFSPQVRG